MSIRIVRLIMSLAYFVFALISRPDICLFSTTSRIQAVVTNGKTVLKDVFLGQVAQALRTRGWRTTFIEVLGPTTWRHLWARGWFFPSDPIHIASHRRLLKRGFYPRLRQRWQSRWLEEKEKIIACLDYRGYDISALVLPLLQEQFALTAPSMELMVNLWRFVFRLWRPKLIYVNHSYGFVAISVVIAAKSLEITSVEQQHGIIGNNHMPYLVPATLDTRVGFPLCDYMITWGEQAKRLFVQRQIYHPDNVFVCGFPRLDKLTREHPHRSTVLQSLNIPLDAKLILYTSNNVHDSYIHLILKGIRNSLDDTNVYWVIKMHPSQQSRRFWEASVDGLGLHRVRVLKGEVDFYALLTACDLHVSFLSTTFIEAALLGKPNLGLDLPHCPDPSGLLEAGAYQPVSLKALGAVVNNILSNESTREILVQKQYAFTQDWCLYDGQSVEHIVTVLESKMREQQYLSGGENERTRQSVFGK